MFKKKISSTFNELRELENDFEDFLKINRIPSDIIYDLRMAVHEYILNVMEHGYHWAPNNEIEFETNVSIKNKTCEVEITITDKAPKFEISKEKVINSVNNKSFRGRGLLMILTFIDDIKYDESYKEGNKVKIKKAFSLQSN